MLKELHLKSGSSKGQPLLSLPLTPSITIFVGPNNSGKSLLLREIAAFCQQGSCGPHTKVLDRVDCFSVDRFTAEQDLQKIVRKTDPNEVVPPNHVAVSLGTNRTNIYIEHYYMSRIAPANHLHLFSQYHLGPSTLSFNGESRLGLLASQQRGDLKNPSGTLGRIFVDDSTRRRWRKIVQEAFGLHVGIDASVGDQLQVRFGSEPPPNERTLEDSTLSWMQEALPIEAVSDGVRAFTGILLQIYAGDPRIIIVDEPEAFLHPSLARSLGRELATAALSENKFIFASTHSADFLMGAIQSKAVINIVRLTWEGSEATARLLPNEELSRLMNDPMLRSVGMLSGLFFQHVVVTEADTDRAFYQEINERLLIEKDSRGIPHALFLNADNHQTIPAIVFPLRKLGIPAASIVDLDVVKRGGQEWTRQLHACGFPVAQQPSCQLLRQSVLNSLIAAAPAGAVNSADYFKVAGGVAILSGSDREAGDNLCDDLGRYGLFIVRKGEVEAWLRDLNVPQKTNGWRSKIFEALGAIHRVRIMCGLLMEMFGIFWHCYAIGSLTPLEKAYQVSNAPNGIRSILTIFLFHATTRPLPSREGRSAGHCIARGRCGACGRGL